MIRTRKTKKGETRYQIDVRVNGKTLYGFAYTQSEAEKIEADFLAQRVNKPKTKIDVMTFLRRAWV